MEKLADCALPELGLDAHSRQLLDFGPRQFELLGEQLKPVCASWWTAWTCRCSGQWPLAPILDWFGLILVEID